ncbi:MAG: hypothetical protein NT013_06075 [Planctomycetia bacterium]|nr:hypothetical protein [Planctomycetia bacterium]
MSKIAIVILADVEGAEALGRIVNALNAAKEFQEGKDQVKVVFSGAGTKWIGLLADPKHNFHGLFAGLKEQIDGACGFCAGAFGVTDAVKSAGICVLQQFGTNMSYRQLINDGYQILTF